LTVTDKQLADTALIVLKTARRDIQVQCDQAEAVRRKVGGDGRSVARLNANLAAVDYAVACVRKCQEVQP
jgi:hypothetical protein